MLILLEGKAQVGKTTMINHLTEKHPELSSIDPSTPFKCLLGMGEGYASPERHALRIFTEKVTERGLGYMLQHLKENQEMYLKQYERIKQALPVRSRHLCIGISEFVRAFDSAFWVNATIEMTPENTHYIAACLDLTEHEVFMRHFGSAYVAKLMCIDAEIVEGDTRKDLLDLTADSSTYTYQLTSSRDVADLIYDDAIGSDSLK